VPVCVTVTHLDALCWPGRDFTFGELPVGDGRSGPPGLVEGEDEKLRAMGRVHHRFYPGRSKLLRRAEFRDIKGDDLHHELRSSRRPAKSVTPMSAKRKRITSCRIWAAIYPVSQVIGRPTPCPRQHPDAVIPPENGAIPGRSPVG